MKKITLLFYFLFIITFTMNAQSSCTTALPATVGLTTVGTLTGTLSPTSCFSSTADYGNWYSYTATIDGYATISSDLAQNDGTTYSDDTRLSIYTGTCGTLTCYATNDDVDLDNFNYLSTVSFPITAGDVFYILWDDNWNGDGFQFEITETSFTCPNDSVPFTHDFTDPNALIACWVQMDSDGDGNGWYSVDYDQDEDGTPDGNPCAASASYVNNVGALTPDNWLISIPVDLTAYSTSDNVQLTWKARGIDASWADENYTVYAATGNTPADFTASAVSFNEIVGQNGGAGVYVDRTLDISSLAGQNIYIAFRHHNSTDQYVLNIDDVAITTSLSTEDFSANMFDYIYTAHNNQLTLKSSNNSFTHIDVYNVSGQQILTKELNSTEELVSLPNIAKGVYVAKVAIGNTIKTIKFAK